jgi:hypothetical protein
VKFNVPFRPRLIRVSLFGFAAWLALTPRGPAYADAVIDVDQQLLSAIRLSAAPPPAAARDIAMVGIAMYDAVDATTGLTYKPYAYPGPAVAGASPDAAAYSAGYRMLASLFPSMAASFQTDENTAIAALSLSPAVQTTSVNLGNSITTNFFNARASDGSATAQTPYTPGNQPGDYQFTKAGQTAVVLPGWGSLTPFAITSVASVSPPPLWGPGTSYPTKAAYLAGPQFQSDLLTVETQGCSTCGQTPDQLALSAFWADTNGNALFSSTATPPGHWLSITDTVAADQDLNLLQTARLAAMVGTSLADAGIVTWNTKNMVNFWRPDTAIHYYQGNTSWQPLWPDPTFQSYISGHSTFSMAAATTLEDFFSTDNISFCSSADPNAHDASNNPISTSGTPYTVTEQDPNGNNFNVTVLNPATRCYSSFTDAAYEAGNSRVIGGIHFPTDNIEGLATGAEVAAEVVANDFTVPEPGSVWLMLTGIVPLLVAFSRREGRLLGVFSSGARSGA